MPEMGLSSAKEAFDVKSLRGIQYLGDWSNGVIENGRERNEGETGPVQTNGQGRGGVINRHTEERTYVPARFVSLAHFQYNRIHL
jgi:hypothetical protein